MTSAAERRDADFEHCVKSRDDVVREKEGLMTQLERCQHKQRQTVQFMYWPPNPGQLFFHPFGSPTAEAYALAVNCHTSLCVLSHPKRKEKERTHPFKNGNLYSIVTRYS